MCYNTINVSESTDILNRIANGAFVVAAQPVIVAKDHNPARQINIYLMNREFIQHLTQDGNNLFLPHGCGAERHDRYIIFRLKLTAQLKRFLALRLC
ncbi:hypothetical protein D3C78_1157670 [compost metagenome]